MHTSLRDRPIPPAGPSADCTADSAGGLTFDVELPGGSERWDAALLLRAHATKGGATPPEDCVRLPLFPSAAGRLRASLPSTMPLAEGRWDGHLALGEGEPQRLRSGTHDLRSLVDRDPGPHRAWLGVRIPYATRQAQLSLRAWQRWPHAEVRELTVGDGGLTLRGRLYGADVTPAARLEARPRQRGAGTPVVAPAGGGGRDFRCALDFTDLTVPGEWDLWLQPARTGQPVRLGRILDDIAEKYRTLAYPAHRSGAHAVTPYWTVDNDLAVRAEPAGAVGG